MGAPAGTAIPFWAWAVFVGLVAALLFLDLFVLHRKAKEIPFSEALGLSGFWIAVSLAFGGFVWAVAGPDAGGRYLTACLVEKSLSVDNVFVFAVIFSGLAVPEKYRYHVLFWGVIGALVFRLLFIFPLDPPCSRPSPGSCTSSARSSFLRASSCCAAEEMRSPIPRTTGC